MKPAFLNKDDGIIFSQNTQISTSYLGIGDPLLIADSNTGEPIVVVAGMSYVVKLCDRKECEDNAWKVRLNLPKGLAGGGIWDLDGKLAGISLATKVSNDRRHRDKTDMLWALPANKVMDFVVSS